MSISNKNFSVVILLLEINIQCQMIVRAGTRLLECAEHWNLLEQGIDDGKTEPPIEIVALCTICLSAAASIHRTLFLGKRAGKKAIRIQKRCAALMSILDHPKLPVINSIDVRNSWEHLDERLDDLLSAKSYNSYSPVHTAAKPPNAGTFVFRHFDPKLLKIKHGTETICLKALTEETNELSYSVDKAFKRLQTELCNVYPS